MQYDDTACDLQELCVRDCITVKSGKRKQDRPYIAKIGSIWKENNGEFHNREVLKLDESLHNREVFRFKYTFYWEIWHCAMGSSCNNHLHQTIPGPVNVTLFWYYRPEEAIGISTTDFQEVRQQPISYIAIQ